MEKIFKTYKFLDVIHKKKNNQQINFIKVKQICCMKVLLRGKLGEDTLCTIFATCYEFTNISKWDIKKKGYYVTIFLFSTSLSHKPDPCQPRCPYCFICLLLAQFPVALVLPPTWYLLCRPRWGIHRPLLGIRERKLQKGVEYLGF